MSETKTIPPGAYAPAATARINIPLDISVWRALPDDAGETLTWFHQFLIDRKADWKEAEELLGYERSTIFRVLKGNYEGSWDKVLASIRAARRLIENQGTIQKNEFAENSISKLIGNALDYALANNSITTIVGESRCGKSIAAKAWADRAGAARAVFITAPPIGSMRGLVNAIAKRCAIPTKHHRTVDEFAELIYRAFNRYRILAVDEAHRLLPNNRRTANPHSIELLRDIHDQTGCGLALISTTRLPTALERGSYIYEQLIGRVGMPVFIKPKIKRTDIAPIVRQFIKNPSAALMDELDKIANAPGRLGILVEILKFASRIASKSRTATDETHVRKAIAIRAQMSAGGSQEDPK